MRDETRRLQRRRSRRRTILAIIGLVSVVAIGIAVQANRSTADGPRTTPAGVTADGFGFAAGASAAPVVVTVYEDFMCPACGNFERTTGGELRRMVADGKVRVVYRPMAFLDGYSTTRYSTRSLNAAACAADAGRFAAYHDQLFANQPAEGGPGNTDQQLAAFGRPAAVNGSDFGRCVSELRFGHWAQRATDAASKAGVVQTPTVLVNGRRLTNPTVTGLAAAVAAATH